MESILHNIDFIQEKRRRAGRELIKTSNNFAGIPLPETIFGRLCLISAISLILAWFSPMLVGYTVGLYDHAIENGPYFLPSHALVLYVLLPIAIIGVVGACLHPGIFLAARYLKRPDFSTLLIAGFGINILLISIVVGVTEGLIQRPLSGYAKLLLLALVNLAAIFISRGPVTDANLKQIDWHKHRHELAALFVFPIALLVLFLPKFFWENLNGDSAHVLLSTKLLVGGMNPYWPEAGGVYGSDPGFATSLTNFVNAWFMRLFGDVEFSIRMLVLLCFPVLLSSILALIRINKTHVDEARTVWFAGLALFLACFVFMYHTAYDPYRADMGTPMAREMLLMTCFFGVIQFFLKARIGFTVMFVALTATAVPSGMPLMVFWGMASILCLRPLPVRMLVVLFMAELAVVILSVAVPMLLAATGQPVPGDEFSSDAILGRLKFVTFDQFHRFAYVMLPIGILPALSLLFFKQQDGIARALTLVVVMYFGLFYFQAYRILLHHFIPAILIPLIVMWRFDVFHKPANGKLISAVVSAGLIAALVLSLPSSFKIHTEGKTYAQSIHLVDNVQSFDEEIRRIGDSHDELEKIVPPITCDGDPDTQFYVAPGTMYYYAQRGADPEPPIHSKLAMDDETGSYQIHVIDAELANAMRQRKTESSTRNPIYFVPRSRLFRCDSEDALDGVINLAKLARRICKC